MRQIEVAVAQLGPVSRRDRREQVVERLLVLMTDAAERHCDLVVFPELALTTFFPRWYLEDEAELDGFFETEMPSRATEPPPSPRIRMRRRRCSGFRW